MSDFNFPHRLAPEKAVEPRVKVSRFGDGYEQRAGDGVNTNAEMWELEFVGDNTFVDSVEDALAGFGAITSFTWTNPKAVEIKVVCRKWQRTYVDHINSSLRATFEQVFET